MILDNQFLFSVLGVLVLCLVGYYLEKKQENSHHKSQSQIRVLKLNKLDKLRKAINQYYQIDGNQCGGNLHIILDDGNYSTEDICFCHSVAENEDDLFGAFLAKKFLALNEQERKELLSLNSESVHESN